MEIHLVRHTTPEVTTGVCYGQSDLDVTKNFHSEANEVRIRLQNLNVSRAHVFSSPLQRCLKLATLISVEPPVTDKRLMELNFGEWEMTAWNDINQTSLNQWMDDFVNARCPDGESYQDLYQRVSDFISELQQQGLPQAVIVAHGGTIRAILCYLGQSTLEASFEIKISYGEVISLKA